MKLDFYEDPGHGWLAVPLELLDALDLLDKVSGYSYMRWPWAYLEEDCDYPLFAAAMKENGLSFSVRTRRTDNRSRIRNYCQYHPGVARVWMQNARLEKTVDTAWGRGAIIVALGPGGPSQPRKDRAMMQFTTPGGKYFVKSHGNGWAYEVTDQNTGETLWFQDDSAAQLQEDTQDFTDNGALAQYF